MLRRIFVLLLLGSVSSSTLSAADGYLGVYASVAGGTTTVGEDLVGFAPQGALRLSVSVANEEGGEELFLDGGVRAALRLELLVDGEPRRGELELAWAKSEQRYAFFGDLPEVPSRAGVLESSVGLKTELTLRRRGGSPWGAGRYEIRLVVDPQAVTLADGSPWTGRGGVAGVRFELREEDSAEARLLALKIRASDAFGAGRYREAAERWAEVVDLDAADDDGWAGLGASYYQLGDHGGAVECLEKVVPAMAEKGLHSALPLFLAESYVAIGELEKARETLHLVVVEPEVASRLEKLQRKVAAASAEE